MFRNNQSLEEYSKLIATDQLAYFRSLFDPPHDGVITDDDLVELLAGVFVMGANERFLSLLENQDQLEKLVELHIERENRRANTV